MSVVHNEQKIFRYVHTRFMKDGTFDVPAFERYNKSNLYREFVKDTQLIHVTFGEFVHMLNQFSNAYKQLAKNQGHIMIPNENIDMDNVPSNGLTNYWYNNADTEKNLKNMNKRLKRVRVVNHNNRFSEPMNTTPSSVLRKNQTYRHMRNIDYEPLLRRMYEKSPMYLSSAHGSQYMNEVFRCPSNVVVIAMGVSGIPMRFGQLGVYVEDFKNPDFVKKLITNPLFRRGTRAKDTHYRSRFYIMPDSEYDDMFLQYQDANQLVGVFPLSSSAKSLPRDFVLDFGNTDRTKQTQAKYDMLPPENNHPNHRLLRLSDLVGQISTHGGGIVILFNCRSPLDRNNIVRTVGNYIRRDKELTRKRRKNIDSFELDFIMKRQSSGSSSRREDSIIDIRNAQTKRRISKGVTPLYLAQLSRLIKFRGKSTIINGVKHRVVEKINDYTYVIDRDDGGQSSIIVELYKYSTQPFNSKKQKRLINLKQHDSKKRTKFTI